MVAVRPPKRIWQEDTRRLSQRSSHICTSASTLSGRTDEQQGKLGQLAAVQRLTGVCKPSVHRGDVTASNAFPAGPAPTGHCEYLLATSCKNFPDRGAKAATIGHEAGHEATQRLRKPL